MKINVRESCIVAEIIFKIYVIISYFSCSNRSVRKHFSPIAKYITVNVLDKSRSLARDLPHYAKLDKRSPRQEVCLAERLFVSFTSVGRRARISRRSNLSWRGDWRGSLVLKEIPRQKRPLFPCLSLSLSPLLSFLHSSYFLLSVCCHPIRSTLGETEINMNFTRQKMEATRRSGRFEREERERREQGGEKERKQG